jgi:uncharacterized sulfatase
MNLNYPLYIAVLIFIFCSCGSPTSQKLEGGKSPNIIFILSDDQAWGDYGFMDHPHIQTPHIDQLAKESATYTRGYVTSPLCGPSLASIITGKYAFQHGQTGNDAGNSNRDASKWIKSGYPDEEPKKIAKKKSVNYLFSKERNDQFDLIKAKFYKHKLLTDYLSTKGYRSFQSGKWWLGSWEEGKFDAGMTHGDYQRNGRHGDEGLKIGREGLDPIFNFIDQTQKDDVPFFVWYAPFLPHTPHNPPEELLDKYLKVAPNENVAKYWAMCEWLDQTVGDLMNHLEEKSLEENTLIVYTTDNGWIQSEKRNRYAPRSKRAPHEGGVRTPIMFKLPGVIQPEINRSSLVSNIDLVPTVLNFLNVTDQSLPGIDVMDKEKLNERETLFIECYNHDILNVEKPTETLLYKVALNKKWKLMVPNKDLVIRDFTDPQSNYYGFYSNQIQLFDLEQDPGEELNLAEKHPEIVAEMSRQIEEWWQPMD